MLLLNDDYVIGIVKEVGDRHVILDVEGREVNRELSQEEADQLHSYVVEQTNLLIPIHKETNELFMDIDNQWNEFEMKELEGASSFLEEEQHLTEKDSEDDR